MGKNRIPKKESSAILLNRGVKENISIPFENDKELIKLVVEHLAYQYQKNFFYMREKHRKEYNSKIGDVDRFKESLTKLLKIQIRFCDEITITRNSFILKLAFKMAKIKQPPEGFFDPKREYKIKGLEFQIIKY